MGIIDSGVVHLCNKLKRTRQLHRGNFDRRMSASMVKFLTNTIATHGMSGQKVLGLDLTKCGSVLVNFADDHLLSIELPSTHVRS